MKKYLTSIMKRISILIISIVSFFGCQNSQKMISVEFMQNDLDSLVYKIEEIHINPYYSYSKEKFYNKIDSLRNSINEPLNVIDFYALIAPIISKLNDGHTELYKPYQDFYNTNPWIFPYTIETKNSEPFIKITEGKGTIPVNSEIISINNIKSETIIKNLLRFETGEDDLFKAEWVAYNFDFYLNTIYNTQSSVLIKYKYKNKIVEKEIKLYKQSEFSEIESKIFPKNDKKHQPYSLKILSDINAAIIDFKSFEDIELFKNFADSTFNLIKEKNINNLIIDIRENAGGNSGIAEEFFKYIMPNSFRLYSEKTKMKVSKQLKLKYQTEINQIRKKKDLSKSDSIIIMNNESVLDVSNGEIIDCPYANEILDIQRNNNSYLGKIFVLTSKKTYSTASDFAQTIKAFKRGEIIGEETGGWIVCFGDIVSDKLFYSNLFLGVSNVKFVNIGANENDWHGVIPDIEMSDEKALKYLINYLNEEIK